jgi:hypothetical protein
MGEGPLFGPVTGAQRYISGIAWTTSAPGCWRSLMGNRPTGAGKLWPSR